MKCSQCSYEQRVWVEFCPQCGTRQSPEKTDIAPPPFSSVPIALGDTPGPSVNKETKSSKWLWLFIAVVAAVSGGAYLVYERGESEKKRLEEEVRRVAEAKERELAQAKEAAQREQEEKDRQIALEVARREAEERARVDAQAIAAKAQAEAEERARIAEQQAEAERRARTRAQADADARVRAAQDQAEADRRRVQQAQSSVRRGGEDRFQAMLGQLSVWSVNCSNMSQVSIGFQQSGSTLVISSHRDGNQTGRSSVTISAEGTDIAKLNFSGSSPRKASYDAQRDVWRWHEIFDQKTNTFSVQDGRIMNQQGTPQTPWMSRCSESTAVGMAVTQNLRRS